MKSRTGRMTWRLVGVMAVGVLLAACPEDNDSPVEELGEEIEDVTEELDNEWVAERVGSGARRAAARLEAVGASGVGSGSRGSRISASAPLVQGTGELQVAAPRLLGRTMGSGSTSGATLPGRRVKAIRVASRSNAVGSRRASGFIADAALETCA